MSKHEFAARACLVLAVTMSSLAMPGRGKREKRSANGYHVDMYFEKGSGKSKY